ncbi:MAG: NrfD/PsrC family molybdoenzyme membrane anchor subunit [Dehalococcoidia bacterium]
MSTNNGSHHYQPQVLTKTQREVTREILRETRTIGPRYKWALAFFGLLLVLGIVGFAIRASDGFDRFSPWGYMMATYAFLLTATASAPLFSISQRMVRSHWSRPMARVAEMFAVVGVLSTLMFIPLLLLLPSSEGRRTIWFEWPGTPFWPQLLAVLLLFVLGMALLFVSAIPDLAACRDHDQGWRQRWARRLTPGWNGTDRQWKVLRGGLMVLGALYFLFLIYVHTIVASDFAMAMVPGWRDAILPTYHALSGLQSAIAATLVAMFLLHRFGGFKDYIHVDQFKSASKILLGLSLLWMYFWFSGFIVYWYGRQPVEQNILKTFMFEAYRWPFVISFILVFLVPFLGLIWNFMRKSLLGPALIGFSILVGTMLDRVRIYVASFSIADKRADALEALHPEPLLGVPAAQMPAAADVFIVLGGIGGAIFLYLLVMKFIPVISIWEVSEGILYRKTVPFLKRTIMVMGKPE